MYLKFRLQIIAILGAQSLFWTKGFRQKDLTFIAQLFTNWIDALILPDTPIWNNTNSLRALDDLQKKGFINSTGRLKNRKYHLTTFGIIELLNKLVESPAYNNISHVILTNYFLSAYGNRMLELVTEKGSGFSKVTQQSIKDLVSSKHYLKIQIRELDKQIERVKIRIQETQRAYQLAEKMSNQDYFVSEIIDKVSLEFPYELDNQKPMTELLKEIEPPLRLWELTDGNKYRSQLLLETELSILENNKQILFNMIKSFK